MIDAQFDKNKYRIFGDAYIDKQRNEASVFLVNSDNIFKTASQIRTKIKLISCQKQIRPFVTVYFLQMFVSKQV